ncbi:MAG TPA: Wall-associated protein precursor [Archangium sp.]|uniref:Wall-associated protein precursor n=1 Tax=Archangium sp. TaxID=1872627 RepID=UPI002E334BC6|nr:Wall-associated protein precursor [Archangium sp.]HEX5746025.1 Wall-associated protein precursor [Archangium sp.]
MRLSRSVLGLWLWVVLASGSSVASTPTLLAQVTCLNTTDCCIRRWPQSAAERCGATPSQIAEALRGARVLQEATAEVTLKEEASEHEGAEADEASEGAESGEPPKCTGQEHHVISRPIARALEKHLTLRGLYEPRDARFKLRAKDQESHCGYQQWHRDVDQEVIRWLARHEKANPRQFWKFLREIYSRPEMRRRFPDEFPEGL